MIETGTTPDLEALLEATRLAVASADGAAADALIERLDTARPCREAQQLRAELSFRRGQVDQTDELLAGIDVHELEPLAAAIVLRRRATIAGGGRSMTPAVRSPTSGVGTDSAPSRIASEISRRSLSHAA